MTDHVWVKHTITPVHTLDNSSGEPVIVVDPDQQVLAEENAVYGCMNCDLPLVPDTFHTECSGEHSEAFQD